MHLLAAISSTESGRWHNQLGIALPWPWTINAEGKGYYFNSKAEAIAKTSALLQSGMRSIDVGCMQVNLKHHAGAFKNLDEAFEPATNVAYGAQFLRSNYDDLGDWVKATAAYHSRTNNRGQEYLVRIEKSWNRIVAKVQQARARQGMETAMAPGPNFQTAASAPNQKSGVTSHATPMHALDSTKNVRVIQVGANPIRTARNDVLVIRQPTAQTMTVKIADATPVVAAPEMMVQQPTGDSIRRVTIDSSGATANNGGTVNTPATRFVFAN